MGWTTVVPTLVLFEKNRGHVNFNTRVAIPAPSRFCARGLPRVNQELIYVTVRAPRRHGPWRRTRWIRIRRGGQKLEFNGNYLAVIRRDFELTARWRATSNETEREREREKAPESRRERIRLANFCRQTLRRGCRLPPPPSPSFSYPQPVKRRSLLIHFINFSHSPRITRSGDESRGVLDDCWIKDITTSQPPKSVRSSELSSSVLSLPPRVTAGRARRGGRRRRIKRGNCQARGNSTTSAVGFITDLGRHYHSQIIHVSRVSFRDNPRGGNFSWLQRPSVEIAKVSWTLAERFNESTISVYRAKQFWTERNIIITVILLKFGINVETVVIYELEITNYYISVGGAVFANYTFQNHCSCYILDLLLTSCAGMTCHVEKSFCYKLQHFSQL